MGTAGLGCPNLLGLVVVERPVRGMVPIPGQAACELQPWDMELSKGESPKEILTMPNRSISDLTSLYAVVVLAAVSLGIVVSALALLVILFVL
jgi:hypothetical protein